MSQLILDVHEEVRGCRSVRWISIEYLSCISHFRDISIVVLAPYLVCKIVNVDPIVTGADIAAVNENGMKAVGELAEICELAVDASIQRFDLFVDIFSREHQHDETFEQ